MIISRRVLSIAVSTFLLSKPNVESWRTFEVRIYCQYQCQCLYVNQVPYAIRTLLSYIDSMWDTPLRFSNSTNFEVLFLPVSTGLLSKPNVQSWKTFEVVYCKCQCQCQCQCQCIDSQVLYPQYAVQMKKGIAFHIYEEKLTMFVKMILYGAAVPYKTISTHVINFSSKLWNAMTYYIRTTFWGYRTCNSLVCRDIRRNWRFFRPTRDAGNIRTLISISTKEGEWTWFLTVLATQTNKRQKFIQNVSWDDTNFLDRTKYNVRAHQTINKCTMCERHWYNIPSHHLIISSHSFFWY